MYVKLFGGRWIPKGFDFRERILPLMDSLSDLDDDILSHERTKSMVLPLLVIHAVFK